MHKGWSILGSTALRCNAPSLAEPRRFPCGCAGSGLGAKTLCVKSRRLESLSLGAVALLLLLVGPVQAQTVEANGSNTGASTTSAYTTTPVSASVLQGANGGAISWIPFGNQRVLSGVAGYASGPVQRVWRGGSAIYIQIDSGEVYRFQQSNADEESAWVAAPDVEAPPLPEHFSAPRPPAGASLIVSHPMQPTVVYALGSQVYRSLDGGRSFSGLTSYRGIALIGESLRDLALNPDDPEDLLVASELGLWRSRDGGLSWFPVSTEGVDNFPLSKLVAFPAARRGLLARDTAGALLEWVPGAVGGWKRATGKDATSWDAPAVVSALGDHVKTWDRRESQIYVGLSDGRLLATGDDGETWREFTLPGWTEALSITVNPADTQSALALMQVESGRVLILRTLNGGEFWEDITPESLGASDSFRKVEAAAPDWEHGVLLVASDKAILVYRFDFRAMGRPALLRRLPNEGLPGPVRDLRLDPSGTMLFVVTARAGVYFTGLPAEVPGTRVRRAADLSVGPVAPGDLVSVQGFNPATAKANGRDASILAVSGNSAQVQLPYGAPQDRILLEMATAQGSSHLAALRSRRVSPAIFLHPDGSPFVLHADSGAMIDENLPALPGERIHILASGLGAVRPDWQAGLPVPEDAVFPVAASVEATVNGLRLPVSQAKLAPGYAGIYLVEVVLPGVLDDGLSEVQILVDQVASNVVPVHVANW